MPANPGESTDLADWLEIRALVAADRNASAGDLERILRASGILEAGGDEAIERTVLEAFRELEDRISAAAGAYPFVVQGGIIQARADWAECTPYVFCLFLSYLGDVGRGRGLFPRRVFEHLARDALREYLGGAAVRFASPRDVDEIPSNFRQAVERLCHDLLLEGEGYKAGGLPGRQDDAVDIIAWKHFPDQIAGKLIVFGNCASERDWEGSKKTELSPEAFWNDWMLDPPRGSIVRSLFIPHRVAKTRFVVHLRKAGIIFDRCRIAYWAQRAQGVPTTGSSRRLAEVATMKEWVAYAMAALE